MPRLCSIDGCGKLHRARGYCSGHYNRIIVLGLPEHGPRASATPEARFWDKVRKDPGGCWLWTGATINEGYGCLRVGVKRVRAHRYSWQLHGGDLSGGIKLDHQCRVKSCVNPDHLKPVSDKENLENVGLYSTNLSGYRGVSWDTTRGKWRAEVTHHTRKFYIGSFETAAEAGEAARVKRMELFSNNLIDRAA